MAKLRLSAVLGLCLLLLPILLPHDVRAEHAAVGHASWGQYTRLMLAQCLVAETGWDSWAEKAAVLHVLVKRHALAERYGIRRPLSTTVRAYCAVHRTKPLSPRQRWIKRLPWGPLKRDPGILDHAVPWQRRAVAWDEIREFVDLMALGEVPDPLPSAIHFGNEQDHRTRVLRGMLGKVRQLKGPIPDPWTAEKVELVNYYYEFQ